MSEEDQEHQDNQAYQRELNEALRYANQQFDKNVLFIASGALGISFAFLEKILKDLETTDYKWLLFASWYLLASVILISLYSHYLSGRAISWAIINMYEDDCEEQVNKKNKLIRRFNIAQMVGLFLGIISLVIFLHLNL